MNATNPAKNSMGNPAMNQTAEIVVNEDKTAVIELEFHSMEMKALKMTGYLANFWKGTDADAVPATILEYYEGIYDIFNDPESEDADSNIKGKWYPKVVTIPIDINNADIAVQVYVPVMESITPGSGTQPALLRPDWNNISKKEASHIGDSVSVSGSVSLNSYIDLSNDILSDSDATVVMSLADGSSETISVQDGTATENGYVFAVALPAKDMAQDVTVQVKNGEGTVVEEYTVSVAKYAEKLIASDTATSEQKDFAKAMLNYGSYAQQFFNTDAENLANANLDESDKILDDSIADSLKDYESESSGSVSGIAYNGSSLNLLAKTEIRHYFEVSDSEITDYTFTVNGKNVSPVQKGDSYYVPISGISAANLGTDYVLTVSKGTQTFKLTYNAMDYCSVTQVKSDDVKLQNLSKALYVYWQAAKNLNSNS